ncbi:MAG: flavin reductase [Duncaniella sp.]|nr:flavin reductase [Duncaniella sp.]
MKNFKPSAWLLPQPVLIIGTFNEDGTPNAMNAAWGGQWDGKEIMISLGTHATTDNLKRDGELTVAFATADTMVAADYVGVVSGHDHPDKMTKAGWKSIKATEVNAPVFTCFPMTLECRIKERLFESASGFYMIAEIVNIVADENYLAEDCKPDVEKINLITFDPIHHNYIALGKTVGKAFHDGLKLKD